MKTWLLKLWYSLNYRFCMAESYLASHRGDGMLTGTWRSEAMHWLGKYQMCGRKLV